MGEFSSLDVQFAQLMEDLSGGNAREVFWAAALASRLRADGHICVDLARVPADLLAGIEPAAGSVPGYSQIDFWLAALRTSPVVGAPGDYKPLILAGSRLYLHRYWTYENGVALALRKLAAGMHQCNVELLKSGLMRLFQRRSAETDWQQIAAAAALLKGFLVISGGPGTGKTTTVAKILALLLEQAGQTPLRIALTAPTGKAAARLQEAIHREKSGLNCSGDVKERMPLQASTLHRFLKYRPGRTDRLYYSNDYGSYPDGLPVDVLVIDEASMVDLPLLASLIGQLPAQARLILLGDRNQLASVEAGAVLGDICGNARIDAGGFAGYSRPLCEKIQELTAQVLPLAAKAAPASPLGDCIVELQKNYRFGTESGIGGVSRAINRGDTDAALEILKSGRYSDIGWRDLPAARFLAQALRQSIVRGFSDCFGSSHPGEVLDSLNRFRIICALREGPFGVRSINQLVERVLDMEGRIRLRERWYRGRPIMITRNDYRLMLFNGDVGVIMPDPEAGNEMRAFFKGADGVLRRFPPLRLPEHETVYATTVHKSQGSEYEEVILLLPDRAAPVLTRELLYTGLTRARNRAELWTGESILRFAVSRQIERTSGLRDALWS